MNRILTKKHIAVPISRFSWTGKIRRLTTSDCSAFFPAEAVVQGEIVHIFFRTDDYFPLKETQTLNAVQCLGILKELIQHLEAARDWMWFPETMVLNSDTVWMGRDGHIRLLYIPDSRELPQFRRLSLFAEQLKKFSDTDGQKATAMLQHQWLDKPHPAHRILSGIDRLILDLQEYSSCPFIR